MNEISSLIDKSREEIISSLGQPDEVGGTSRKYKHPSVYKYANTEYHFDSKSGKCFLIMCADTHKVIAKRSEVNKET